MIKFKFIVLLPEGESWKFPYLPVVKRPEYISIMECAIFPLNYALRAWYWLLKHDKGAFNRLKPYRVDDLRSENIEASLLEYRALTGQDLTAAEVVMDALHRSNKLYAAGVDNHRLYWLLDGIHDGRIDARTPVERTTDAIETELADQRRKTNARRGVAKGGK